MAGGSKEKFRTINSAGGAVTAIRKGSKYDKDFLSSLKEQNKISTELNSKKRLGAKLDRKISKGAAATGVVRDIKQKAKKYGR